MAPSRIPFSVASLRASGDDRCLPPAAVAGREAPFPRGAGGPDGGRGGPGGAARDGPRVACAEAFCCGGVEASPWDCAGVCGTGLLPAASLVSATAWFGTPPAAPRDCPLCAAGCCAGAAAELEDGADATMESIFS